jgi:hypothetical protein
MHSDERELTESVYRYSGPALVWAALLALFAIAGGCRMTSRGKSPTRRLPCT